MKARNYLLSIFIFLCILSVNAQVSDCNCTDMIYLNDEDRDESISSALMQVWGQ
ncbi:MAG: hypothetical protein IPO37_09385 [Saprospiraceae bacterium]|nr:hypothetical protein [Saprospiraceae bacterium]